MINPTRIRYWIGWSAFSLLDAAVLAKSLPAHFPPGLHLEYDLQRFLAAPVTTIVDGGANVGDTAVRFARYFNVATVHAFEPVGTTFRRLEKRVKNHPRIVCRQLALGEQETKLAITLSDESQLNSLLDVPTTPDAANSETVQVVRLDDYAQAQGLQKIDLLKLDLEGYELPALRGASRLLKEGAIRAVYSECGFINGDPRKTSFSELNELMHQYGYQFAGFHQTQYWGPNRRRALFSNGLWLQE